MEFKIFRTVDNEEYTVCVRDDGNMFYVDWEQQVGVVFFHFTLKLRWFNIIILLVL